MCIRDRLSMESRSEPPVGARNSVIACATSAWWESIGCMAKRPSCELDECDARPAELGGVAELSEPSALRELTVSGVGAHLSLIHISEPTRPY